MPYKPFLCHKREDAAELALLHDELALRGAGGWQDVADLRVGQRWNAAFKRAIGRETGGFIWYGTRLALSSWTIRKIEVPAALRRARRDGDGAYPFVPLFVDLRPGDDAAVIKKAFGRRRGGELLGMQGVDRGDGESTSDFGRRAARAYVRDLIRAHGSQPLHIAITGGRPPTADHDLALDWRRLLDSDGRLADPAAVSTLVETLADIRDAAQAQAACPHFIVEPHLRLPLAALVGWHWNSVRPVKLTVVQRSVSRVVEVDDRVVSPDRWPTPRRARFGGDGPFVLAVSVGKDLGDAIHRYATRQSAREFAHLHVPLEDFPGRALGAEDICSLTAWTTHQLADLNAQAVPKHLLLLGPVSLAMRIGTAANASGKTVVPFWDGGADYQSGVVIG